MKAMESMEDKCVLILGAGLMQRPAIEAAQELGYRKGEFKTNAEVRHDLSLAYKRLGIHKAAKATDIKEYYSVKIHRPRDKQTGKQLDGYLILGSLFVFGG